ncbi:hypothetical protein EJB05_40615, partial [Eragrostis curvula]
MAVAFLALLLLLLLSGSPPSAFAAGDGEHGYTLVEISSLQEKDVCSGHRVPVPPNRTWVPLSLLHGSCSPASSARAKPTLAELLRHDEHRVEDIHRRLSGFADEKRKKIKKRAAGSMSTQMNSGPVLDVNMGTLSSTSSQSEVVFQPTATGGSSIRRRRRPPGVRQTVMVDTASDVPWVQCRPCSKPPCRSFDPARSNTYAAFRCNSTDCARLGPNANGCFRNQCQYRASSPDGLTSTGTYGSDVLAIGPARTIRRFKFGCSRAMRGSIGSAAAGGIMALGGGAQTTLVAQAASAFGNAFSYCIPPTPSYPGFFTLGSPIAAASRRFVRTPLVRDGRSPATFHRVLLRAVSVAGRTLDVPPQLFAAGTVLDSRTTITRLPLTAYQALRAAFRSSMAAYRKAPRKGILDTCFNFTGVPVVNLPKVALVFDRNAVLELDPSGILFNDCLAFASNADDTAPGILGNVQQQTIEVLYDLATSSVGFRRLAC